MTTKEEPEIETSEIERLREENRRLALLIADLVNALVGISKKSERAISKAFP